MVNTFGSFQARQTDPDSIPLHFPFRVSSKSSKSHEISSHPIPAHLVKAPSGSIAYPQQHAQKEVSDAANAEVGSCPWVPVGNVMSWQVLALVGKSDVGSKLETVRLRRRCSDSDAALRLKRGVWLEAEGETTRR